MNAARQTFDFFESIAQIAAASPFPLLMLGTDGSVLAASDETIDIDPGPAAAFARSAGADSPLRSRAAHYLAQLRGEPPWLTPQQAESARRATNGEWIHERLHLRRAPWGSCIAVVDETALRRLQTADLQTARLAALGFIVAGVCHEVTNPLTSLHSIVQFLRAQRPPSAALLEKGLDNIALNVRRILEISRRLVTFSRAAETPYERFAVDEAIDEALAVLRQQGRLDRIPVTHERDPAALALGHPGEMREVFLNLFVNAVQAMSGEGRLAVVSRAAAERIEVTVSDSGAGIPPAAVGRIFEPFFTTKAETHGTGLGLAISAELMREHRGRIEVVETSTRGTSFRVTLPRERA